MGEFDRMISSTDETEPVVDEQLQITDEEYIRWERRWLPLNPLLYFEVIHALKDRIEQYNLQIQMRGCVVSSVCVGPSVEENGEAAESFCFPEWIGHYPPFGLYIAVLLPLE